MLAKLVKKVVLSKLNKALAGSDISEAKASASKWIGRLEEILRLMRQAERALDDNQVSDAELDEALAGIEEVVRKW